MSVGCVRDEKFPSIGAKFAGPIDVAVDASGEYFFVLSADTDRTYNHGNIVTLNKEGQKLSAVETPRLGKSLTLSGDTLIATFESAENTENQVVIYDVSQPEKITISAAFDLDCSPLNAVLNSTYAYFAVSCYGGGLYVGELKTPRQTSTIHKVRQFSISRRAMFLDPSRNLLFLFTTDLGRQSIFDTVYNDAVSINTEGIESPGGNEMPDELERQKSLRENKARHESYQFAVLNLAEIAAEGFPLKLRTDSPEQYQKDLRWLYFNLSNYDGVPDITRPELYSTPPTQNNYRVNFWEAKPDPANTNAFYLSHRGHVVRSPYANNILKIEITGDPLAFDAQGKPPTLTSYFSVSRVYGFNGEVKAWHYPGDFEIVNTFGEPILIVNHFKDLVNRENDDALGFGLAARPVNNFNWLQEMSDNNPTSSFYQVAVNERGTAISCLFYTNAVIIFQVSPTPGSFTSRIINNQ